jgi:multicomponent Na+:H+ antiporter subunit D
MSIPAVGLIALGLLAGLAPRLTGAAESAAIHFQDRDAYARRVLDELTPYPPSVGDQPLTGGDLVRGLGSLAAALAFAFVTLRWPAVRRATRFGAPIRALRELHSGIIPDYVTWVMVGVAVFGAASALWLRSPY